MLLSPISKEKAILLDRMDMVHFNGLVADFLMMKLEKKKHGKMLMKESSKVKPLKIFTLKHK